MPMLRGQRGQPFRLHNCQKAMTRITAFQGGLPETVSQCGLAETIELLLAFSAGALSAPRATNEEDAGAGILTEATADLVRAMGQVVADGLWDVVTP